MQLPFTTEQFLDNFKNYNLAIWPIQIGFYLLAAIAVYLILRKGRGSGKVVSAILSFFWLWMGIAYHLIYFTAINKAAFLFGAIFILQGLIFLYVGIIKNNLSFKLKPDFNGITGAILVLFALVVYPILGYGLGHAYPSSPTFGLPCPTTIFTFGILLWIDKKFPIAIVVIPFLWSIIGFTAAFSLGITEDIALLVSGLAACILLILLNRKLRHSF
jgi:hypothetical protein